MQRSDEVAMEGYNHRAPVAALLFDPGTAPAIDDVEALAQRSGRFSVFRPLGGETIDGTPAGGTCDDGSDGADWVELLRDGLTFDLAGFAGGRSVSEVALANRSGIAPTVALHDAAVITLAPGPHLAGAANLLPVIRVIGALLLELMELPGLIGVAWLPAQLVSGPDWFARAIRAWLDGGPFPALALAAINRDDATFTSTGLGFLTGQEFTYTARDGMVGERDTRIVLRLVDWLVAHGRLVAPREVELAGVGAVRLEPLGQHRIAARIA
ncbi:hypothetical protein [Novosphingobium sp.]|uniref:hypothetical protein n=1 Tax=Novosphingobium sp. TaxID=1874826 RepID=UPI0038B9F6D4